MKAKLGYGKLNPSIGFPSMQPASGAALSELESMGMLTCPSTAIARTRDQRTDAFYNSKFECTDPPSFQYSRSTLMEFDHRVTEQPAARGQDAEQPNLNDAVSC